MKMNRSFGLLLAYMFYLCPLITGRTNMPPKLQGTLKMEAEFRCETDIDWSLLYFKRHTAKPDVNKPNFENKFKDVIFAPSNGNYEVTTEDSQLKTRVSFRKMKEQQKTIFIMMIANLECSDAGFYQCRVNGRKQEQAQSELLIVAPPMMPVIKPRPVEQEENMKLRLTCEANVGAPYGNLTWYKQPLGLSKGLMTATNMTVREADSCRGYKIATINIVASRNMHNTNYYCYASKKDSTPTASRLMDMYTLKVKGMSTTTAKTRVDKSKDGGTGLSTPLTLMVLSSLSTWLLRVANQ